MGIDNINGGILSTELRCERDADILGVFLRKTLKPRDDRPILRCPLSVRLFRYRFPTISTDASRGALTRLDLGSAEFSAYNGYPWLACWTSAGVGVNVYDPGMPR